MAKGLCSSGYGRGNNIVRPDTTTGKTIVLMHHNKGQHAEACWDQFSRRRQVKPKDKREKKGRAKPNGIARTLVFGDLLRK